MDSKELGYQNGAEFIVQCKIRGSFTRLDRAEKEGHK